MDGGRLPIGYQKRDNLPDWFKYVLYFDFTHHRSMTMYMLNITQHNTLRHFAQNMNGVSA